jgi:hypothetical protein
MQADVAQQMIVEMLEAGDVPRCLGAVRRREPPSDLVQHAAAPLRI